MSGIKPMEEIMSQSGDNSLEKGIFERECGLYLKAYENVRNEISESIKLQYNAVKIGLTFLSSVSALTFFLGQERPLLPFSMFLCVGFLTCSFMYLLLTGEIRIMRAGGFCKELEGHFQRHPEIDGLQSRLGSGEESKLCLWEHYVEGWNERMFKGGHFERKTLYAPFRILITLVDLLALVYLGRYFSGSSTSSLLRIPFIFKSLIAAGVWAVSVIAHVFIIQSVTKKVDAKMEDAYSAKKHIEPPSKGLKRILEPLKLFFTVFFVMDLIVPGEMKRAGNERE